MTMLAMGMRARKADALSCACNAVVYESAHLDCDRYPQQRDDSQMTSRWVDSRSLIKRELASETSIDILEPRIACRAESTS